MCLKYLIRKIGVLKSYLRTLTLKPRLKKMGKNVRIGKGFVVNNPKFVSIGDDVILRENISFFVNPIQDNAELIIGNRVDIGKNNDFGCSNKIIIEDDVITAPFVHITDRDHTYTEINIPIKKQCSNSKGPVVIGKGSWIGFGVQIMSGVKIGNQCVIGAGSIVTKDIPDYSIAAGNPARIVKRYNHKNQQWERI